MSTRKGMKVTRAKGRLRGKKPKLSPRQESHLVSLREALARLLTDTETYVARDTTAVRGSRVHRPGGIDVEEVADLLSSTLGRMVVHEPTSAEDFVANAGAYGLSRAEAEGIAWLFAEVMNGSVSHVTKDLTDLLGRPTSPTADYIARTAPTGVDQLDRQAS